MDYYTETVSGNDITPVPEEPEDGAEQEREQAGDDLAEESPKEEKKETPTEGEEADGQEQGIVPYGIENYDEYMEQTGVYRDAVVSDMALLIQDSEIIKESLDTLTEDDAILGDYLQCMYEQQVRTESALNYANIAATANGFLLAVIAGVLAATIFRRLK